MTDDISTKVGHYVALPSTTLSMNQLQNHRGTSFNGRMFGNGVFINHLSLQANFITTNMGFITAHILVSDCPDGQ